MRIIECDRCHKRIGNDKEKTGYVNLDMRDARTGELEGNREFEEWDLCDDCLKEIRDFVKMKPKQEAPKVTEGFKVVDVKPTAVIKRPVTDKITPEKIERIKALAKEGKTVKEIAAEVGVSDPTVRKYKAEVTSNAGE